MVYLFYYFIWLLLEFLYGFIFKIKDILTVFFALHKLPASH